MKEQYPDDWERIMFALDIIKHTDYYQERSDDYDFSIWKGVYYIEQATKGDEWA